MTKIMNDKDPVVLLERNLYGHPLAGLLCERQFEQVLSEVKLEKVPKLGNACQCIDSKVHYHRNTWNDIKMSGKEAEIWRQSGRN